MEIRFLKAYNGDCILISLEDEQNIKRNILIDGGISKTYEYKNRHQKSSSGPLQDLIEELRGKEESIDLLVMTHVDADHIDGILKWFSADQDAYKVVKKVWFNSGRLISEYFKVKEIEDNLLPLENLADLDAGIQAGVNFEDYIEKHNLWQREIIDVGQFKLHYGLKFKILSPNSKNLKRLLTKWDKEHHILDASIDGEYQLSLKEHMADLSPKRDSSIHNASSIAFIIDYEGKNLVFLGDARADEIVKGLNYFNINEDNPLNAEFIKLSHHGSFSNISGDLLNLIKTNNYIISTNGDKHNHPHKKCMAQIINHNPVANLLFNYPERIDYIFSKKDREDYPLFKTREVGIIQI